jgi:hypothetical protein
MIEVTSEHELVREYISPYYGMDGKSNYVYRAYRVPYEWVLQLDRPTETAVRRIENSKFRVPGVDHKPEQRIAKLEGAKGFSPLLQLCVVDTRDLEE